MFRGIQSVDKVTQNRVLKEKKIDDLPKRLVRCKVFCILTKFGGLLTQTLTALEDILWGKGFPLVPRADLQ